MFGGHHECSIFKGTVPEAEESAQGWRECEKNPGHEKFISVPDFVDNYLPKTPNVAHREYLKEQIDRTVRLRVNYTSLGRPEGGDFSDCRGKPGLRVGTGYIVEVNGPVENKRCRCFGCNGRVMRRHWKIYVQTARHVVYNWEEAEKTKVDLYYDDTDSDKDGRMKSLRGIEIKFLHLEEDHCVMKCVTCDEGLVERIACSAMDEKLSCRDLRKCLSDLGLLQSCRKDCVPVLIVSHPHSRPKQITLGERMNGGGRLTPHYSAPTCPGSSGAQVHLGVGHGYPSWMDTTHSGSYGVTSTERYDRHKPLTRLFNKLRGQETPILTQQLNYSQ